MAVRMKLTRVVLSAMIAGSVCSGVSALTAENVSAATISNQSNTKMSTSTAYSKTSRNPRSLYKGSTMVPMRGVFEALNAQLECDGATQTVTATKDHTTIKLIIGNNYAYVNGQKVVLTTEAIITQDGSTPTTQLSSGVTPRKM